MKLRLKFSKFGRVKFIGHLDVMRYFQKAIRRAKIDIEYSTGFSPHQIMAFAAPLGVGIESEGEYFDIQVKTVTSSEDIKRSLNEQMAEGFVIKDVVLLPDNAPNAMASVAAAAYKVNFREGRGPHFDILEAVNRFKNADAVNIIKQTKKSEIEIDIKPSVYELECKEDGLYMLVDASSAGNIKPELVLRALYAYYDEEIVLNAYIVTRIETYGLDSDKKLIPLIEFGQNF